MNETFTLLIKAIEAGELVITEVSMYRPSDRDLPPWAPYEATWCFKTVRVPEEHQIKIDLSKQYLAKVLSEPGPNHHLAK